MTLYDTRLTHDELLALSVEVLGRWNAHDVDGLVSHLSDDIVWTFPLQEEPLHGRSAVAEDLEDMFTAFPDLQIPEEEFVRFADPERQLTMQRWIMTGTMTGPSRSAGLPATGRSVRIVGSTFCRVRAGSIWEWTTTYDALDFMQQTGLLPKADGMGFKAVVMADVLAGKARKVLHRQRGPHPLS